MLSNRDWIRSLKLADVTMPETFLCKIVKFLYSIASDVFWKLLFQQNQQKEMKLDPFQKL